MNENQVDSSKKYPRIGVGVMIFRGPALLLSKRGGGLDKAGTWGLPGGKMDPDEDWEVTVRRELIEEIGLDIGDSCPLQQLGWVNYIGDGGQRWITLFVEARIAGAAYQVQNMEPDKCAALEFHEITQLPQPLFEPLASFLREREVWRPR
jgi:8-oxo-dGTP diphosphatase